MKTGFILFKKNLHCIKWRISKKLHFDEMILHLRYFKNRNHKRIEKLQIKNYKDIQSNNLQL